MSDTEADCLTVGPASLCNGLVSVACWQGQLEAHCAGLCDKLDGRIPEDGRRSTIWRSGYIFRTARDRLLIQSCETNDLESLVRGNLVSGQAAISDLSHAWRSIDLSGRLVPDLLSRCLSIDCSESGLPVGCFAQTHLQDAQVLLHRKNGFSYTLLVQTSFSVAVEAKMRKITKKII